VFKKHICCRGLAMRFTPTACREHPTFLINTLKGYRYT
jgi:hypothetical protein